MFLISTKKNIRGTRSTILIKIPCLVFINRLLVAFKKNV